MGKTEELEAKIEDLRTQIHRVAKGDELKTKASGFRLGTIRVYEDIKGILRCTGKITAHYGTAAARAASTDYQEGVFWWESDNDELFIGTGAGWQDVGGASVGGAHNFLSSTSHTDTVTQGATRGSMVVANSTPKWDEFVKGSSGNVLRMADANDPGWSAPGISDTNIVKVDGSPSDDEYARWTASGLEGRTAANVRTDIDFVAQAIAAVEGEATLDLTGNVTIAGDKSLAVDVISEKDANAGVTADGVTLKDDAVEVDALRGLKESGGQALDMGAVADGEFLKRDGTDIVGAAAGGGATDEIWDADTDTGIQVEEAEDEDKIRFDRAGSQEGLWDSSGLSLTCNLGIAGSAMTATRYLVLNPTKTETADGQAVYIGPIITANQVNPQWSALAGDFNMKVGAGTSWTSGFARGLQFGVMANNATGTNAAIDEIVGVRTILIAMKTGAGTLTITDAIGLHSPTLVNVGSTVTNYTGLQVPDCSAATNNYLAMLGPTTAATCYLYVAGGAAPGANETNLYLREENTVRRVQWKAGDTLGAGDKVMILV